MKKTLSLILCLVLIMVFATTSLGLSSVAVKSIKLLETNYLLEVGRGQTLIVTIAPTNATNQKLTYTSSNKKVATVSANGRITAVKAGKAVITVTSSSNKKLVAKCNVTVVTQVSMNLKGRTITLMDSAPAPGWSKYDLIMARQEDLQAKYNFKLKYISIPSDELAGKVASSIMAGQPVADVLLMNYNFFYPGLVNKGFVLPLDTLFDFSNPKWDKVTMAYTKFNDRIYGFYPSSRFYPQRMMFFNKTMFAKAGIPNPYELQKNMQWTWDKCTEYAMKLTKDTNGDGQIEQWGFCGQNLEMSAIYSNGGADIKIEKGKPVLAMADPAAVEAMDWLQKLAMINKCLYIPKNDDPWDKATQMFQNGQAAMFAYAYWVIDGFQKNMKDDYGLISFPMGPKAKNYITYVDSGGYGIHCLPKGLVNPKDVAFIYDKLTDPYPIDLQNPNQWRTDYSTALRDKESLDTLDMMWNYNNINFGMLSCFQKAQEMEWQVAYDLLHSQKTASQIMDAVKSPMQAAINDVIAQK